MANFYENNVVIASDINSTLHNIISSVETSMSATTDPDNSAKAQEIQYVINSDNDETVRDRNQFPGERDNAVKERESSGRRNSPCLDVKNGTYL